ncbi:hypothetical protein SETIT_6G193800v2, partial [Setaria italica]
SRRRFRLVGKRWRDLVDKRTPERQARTKILAFFAESCGSRAVVFDGEDGSRRCHAWTYPCSYDLRYDLVGTCNGLLCLHERSAFGVNAGSLSAISVVNPITGESQLLSPAPMQRHWEQFKAFGMHSFGYHPTTGEYKVVHIPCRQGQAVGAVWVFTLGGGTSWREVPGTTPGAVSVDGFTYWLDALADRVMALDLQDERVTCFNVPPALRRGLTPERKAASTRGWASPLRRRGPGWRCGCWRAAAAEGGRAPRPPGALDHGAAPDPREYAMSRSWGRARLYRSKVGNLIDRHGNNGLPPLLEGAAELVMDDDTPHYEEIKTFAYVETLEPLPAMDGPAAGDGGSNQARAANGGMEKNVRG